MKRNLIAFGIATLVSGALLASEITVPDLETLIRGSGSAVPTGALPELSLPKPVVIPEVAPAEPDIPEDTPTFAVTDIPTADIPEPIPPKATSGGIGGHAELGSGSPSVFHGDVLVAQEDGDLPGFTAAFSHDSADGYGTKDSGRGYFDRSTVLSLLFFHIKASHPWHAGITARERSDGLQGLSQDYYSISTRTVDWTGALDFYRNEDAGLRASLSFEGGVYSFAGERPLSATAPVFSVADWRGFRMSPGLSFTASRGEVTAGLHGSYEVESEAEAGDLQSLRADLQLSWLLDPVTLFATAGVFYDSEEGILPPFEVGLRYEREDSLFSKAHISGGLLLTRQDIVDLALEDPFIRKAGLSVYAADWFGKARLDLSIPSGFSAGLGLLWRRTWDKRYTLVSTGTAGVDGLINLDLVSRESLETEASVARAVGIWNFGVSWKAEWMDAPYVDAVHWLTANAEVADRSIHELWALFGDISVAVDGDDLPRLALGFSYRPLGRLKLTLSAQDLLYLVSADERLINDIYRERGGSVMLSGRIDF